MRLLARTYVLTLSGGRHAILINLLSVRQMRLQKAITVGRVCLPSFGTIASDLTNSLQSPLAVNSNVSTLQAPGLKKWPFLSSFSAEKPLVDGPVILGIRLFGLTGNTISLTKSRPSPPAEGRFDTQSSWCSFICFLFFLVV